MSRISRQYLLNLYENGKSIEEIQEEQELSEEEVLSILEQARKEREKEEKNTKEKDRCRRIAIKKCENFLTELSLDYMKNELTIKEIADKYHISRNRVYHAIRALKEEGVIPNASRTLIRSYQLLKVHYNLQTEEEVKQAIIVRYMTGSTVQEIAWYYNRFILEAHIDEMIKNFFRENKKNRYNYRRKQLTLAKDVIEKLEQKYSTAQIAEDLELTEDEVKTIIAYQQELIALETKEKKAPKYLKENLKDTVDSVKEVDILEEPEEELSPMEEIKDESIILGHNTQDNLLDAIHLIHQRLDNLEETVLKKPELDSPIQLIVQEDERIGELYEKLGKANKENDLLKALLKELL